MNKMEHFANKCADLAQACVLDTELLIARANGHDDRFETLEARIRELEARIEERDKTFNQILEEEARAS